MSHETVTFSFGENWQRYLETLTPEKLDAARRQLAGLLRVESLEGRTFLDLGCGSGLMSLCALRLGAAAVASVDVDPNSVEATRRLSQRFPSPNWTIREGSVLDDDFLDGLGRFDVVYSWGVLHHTGEMWRAIENAAGRVEFGGLLCLAIYNRTPRSEFWLRFKRRYNRSGALVKRLMVWSIFLPRAAVRLLKGRHPLRDRRGMNVYHDAIDWAGGLPYEFATFGEVRERVEALGFELVHGTRTRAIGCNEFLFRARGASRPNKTKLGIAN